MRKFIKSILLFIPVSLVAYIILVCLWGELVPKAFQTNLTIQNRNENTYMRLHELPDYKNIDILFLGSSRAYSSFDIRMYEHNGYSAFNLGTSAQTPLQTKILLERYLEVLNPELIIYEVSPPMFSSDGIESSTDIIANGRCDMAALEMGLKSRHLKVLNTLIFRIYTKAFQEGKEREPGKLNHDNEYIQGGYVESRQMEYKPVKTASDPPPGDMNQEQLSAFESIVDMINSQNIELILLQVPFAPSRYTAHQAVNQSFDQDMQHYGAYFNLNESMHLVDTIHFRDESHLNLTGVSLLNERIINMLNL